MEGWKMALLEKASCLSWIWLLPFIGPYRCHSAIAPPRGGGEASLKEQYEAGLEHIEAEQESGLMWLALEGEHARAALANPVPVAMDNKVGRLRKREEHSPTPGAVAPPRNIWLPLSSAEMDIWPPLTARAVKKKKKIIHKWKSV